MTTAGMGAILMDYEIIYVGEVPIEGTPYTAPGMARYKTSLQGGIDTWFTWSAR